MIRAEEQGQRLGERGNGYEKKREEAQRNVRALRRDGGNGDGIAGWRGAVNRYAKARRRSDMRSIGDAKNSMEMERRSMEIRIVLDTKDDPINPDLFLKEFREYIEKGYYVREIERVRHGEDKQ